MQRKYPDWFKEPTPEEAAASAASEAALRKQEALRRRAERVARFLDQVGTRYRGVSFGTYEVTYDAQRAVVEALKQYAANIEEEVRAGNGVVLFGPPGTGKDHLLVALGVQAAVAGFRVLAVSGLDLFAEARDRIGDDRPEEALVDRLATPDVLVLSDPVPPSGALTDCQAALLLRIIDRRYRDCRPTWVSLNVANGAEADDRMGAAVVDRLKDGALCLHCDWVSYRKPAALGQRDEA